MSAPILGNTHPASCSSACLLRQPPCLLLKGRYFHDDEEIATCSNISSPNTSGISRAWGWGGCIQKHINPALASLSKMPYFRDTKYPRDVGNIQRDFKVVELNQGSMFILAYKKTNPRGQLQSHPKMCFSCLISTVKEGRKYVYI